MWPFRRDDQTESIRGLRQALEQAEEAHTDACQRAGESEHAMRKMQKALSEEGLNEIARAATARIADIYACGAGSVRRRDEAVWAVIHQTVREATQGERHWDTGRLAAAAYEEKAT